MNLYPDSDIETIRTQAALDTFAANHLTLVRAGNGRVKALCPFHDEKTPSFIINTDSNTWHCFGACSTGGDIIDFTRELLGLDFREAIEHLGSHFHIALHPAPRGADSDQHTRREHARILAALADAQTYFAEHLASSPDAAPARTHLEDRGFGPDLATTFGCGYAPTDSTALIRHLTSRGHSHHDLQTAGLLSGNRAGGSPRSLFRGRLTWPIANTLGQPIAFGARRILDRDPLPNKYINSPETALYRKSTTLYGYDRARRAIVHSKCVLICEGYTDVMAAHAAGLTMTVATCGTALTADHVASLRRAVGAEGEFVFGFDGDSAGVAAARHNYRAARGSLLRLSALPDTSGRDPADVRTALGDSALANLFDQRRPLLESLISAHLASVVGDTPEERLQALTTLKPLFEDITDPLLHAEYARQVATKLRFEDSREVAQRLTATPTRAAPPTPPAEPGAQEWLERLALQVCVLSADLARLHLPVINTLLTPDSQTQRLGQAITDALSTTGIWTERLLTAARDHECVDDMTHLLTIDHPCPAPRLPQLATEVITRMAERRDEERHDLMRHQLATADTPQRRSHLLRQLTDPNNPQPAQL